MNQVSLKIFQAGKKDGPARLATCFAKFLEPSVEELIIRYTRLEPRNADINVCALLSDS